MRIYTHVELVEKLKKASNEIKRLKGRPDHTQIIKDLIEENKKLRGLNDSIVKQRNELWKCLKWNHEKE